MTWQKHLLETLENNSYALVKLNIDGYNVSYHNQISGRKVVVMTYVNGLFKGIWSDPEVHPETRFLKPKWYRPGKREQEMEKTLCKIKGTRYNKESYIKSKSRIILYIPVWSSPKEIITHLKKQAFKSIEIMHP
jgi:hypothetical protein